MSKSFLRSGFLSWIVAAGLVLVLVGVGYSQDWGNLGSPGNAGSQTSWAPGVQQFLKAAVAAQERHTDDLLTLPDVVGTAVGLTQDGQAAVKVFTKGVGVRGIPRSLDGVPVVVEVTGEIFALHHRPGHSGGPSGGGSEPSPSLSPTDKWPRPVPIGVSTGNDGECSAGTIGARVKAGTDVYALSNNHVYALENTAAPKSDILQPGRYDTSCSSSSSDVIGTLYAFEPIVFSTSANNVIDAAIASSSTAQLGNSTPPDGYGTPRSVTVGATPNQSVQKYGRTTALTRGSINAVNAIVNVGYSSGTARFVDQIVVYSNKGPFIKGGDSGSLLVTDPGLNPVGLLFAGDASGKWGIANPIEAVLSRFDITIDGE